MATTQPPQTDFVKAISRLDATALVVGSMIGSGIFIVSAEILREVHSPGLLLVVWAASGVVTLMGALSYGELAAMFPKAGGQYVYLREGISPLFAYLYVLPATAIATAPQDRVGTAALQAILGQPGLKLMAAAIMISTFGCNNGLILSGARVYYAMARDDLFFKSAGVLHPRYKMPAVALVVQAVW